MTDMDDKNTFKKIQIHHSVMKRNSGLQVMDTKESLLCFLAKKGNQKR